MPQRKDLQRIRHWKQTLDPTKQLVWAKRLLWAGEYTRVGDSIPDSIPRTRLQRLWFAGAVAHLRPGPPNKSPKSEKKTSEAKSEAPEKESDQPKATSTNDVRAVKVLVQGSGTVGPPPTEETNAEDRSEMSDGEEDPL